MLGYPALGLPRQKMPIGAPRPGLQVGAQGILPAVAEHGADRPRLQAVSCRANVTKPPCGGCLDVPWECGSPPQARCPRGQCHCQLTSQPALPSGGDSQPAGGWEHYRPWRQERQPQRVGFQASIAHPVCGSSDTRPPGLLPGPQIPSGQVSACTL